MFFNEKKRKRLHNFSWIPRGFGRGTNMAAVSLFRGSNMAAVTSYKKQEYI